MEDYSQEQSKPTDGPSPIRNLLRGEFLSDWLGRLRQPETPKNVYKSTESPASKLGEIAELSYMAHDLEPVSPDELQRQQVEAQRRRQVIGLKMGTPNLESEKQTMSERQTVFGQELPAQKETVPFVGYALQENVQGPLPINPEDRIQTIRQAQYKELAITSPEDKPGDIAEVVGEAAELNIPIEQMYERRHELKDENDDNLTTINAVQQPIGSRRNPYGPHNIADKEETLPKQLDSVMLNSSSSLPHHTSMYRQAVMVGFWMAVVLVIGGFVFIVVSN